MIPDLSSMLFNPMCPSGSTDLPVTWLTGYMTPLAVCHYLYVQCILYLHVYASTRHANVVSLVKRGLKQQATVLTYKCVCVRQR